MTCSVGVIGCGGFTSNHLNAWRSLEGADVVALCDLDPARLAAATALAPGASTYSRAEDLLAGEKLDVVDIIAPAPAHLPLAELCAMHKTPAIIQKPLAMTLEDAVKIAGLAETHGVSMMVHENFRFQRPIREVHRLVASGLVGKPRYCRIDFRTRYQVFPRSPELRQGGRLLLMDMGVHLLDVARFLMGEIESLSCLTSASESAAGEDLATILIAFESGAQGIVGMTSASETPWAPRLQTLIEIEGSLGAIALGRDYQITVRAGDVTSEYCAAPPVPEWGARPWHVVQDSVVETCRHWLRAAAGETAMETSVADNLRTMAAVEACYRSALSGGGVSPSAVMEMAGA